MLLDTRRNKGKRLILQACTPSVPTASSFLFSRLTCRRGLQERLQVNNLDVRPDRSSFLHGLTIGGKHDGSGMFVGVVAQGILQLPPQAATHDSLHILLLRPRSLHLHAPSLRAGTEDRIWGMLQTL